MFRVLLVDDEPLILEHTRRLLEMEKQNYVIVGTASNGLDGIELIRNLHPDVAILDVMMPGATGLEVIDAVQDENCRFIIVSGYQEFEYVRHALRAGVVDYLLKPLSASELSAALSRLLGGEKDGPADYAARYGSVVASVIRSIEEHYMESDYNLSWLCENELFMDETYISRLFKQKTEVRFNTWLNRRRLEEAENLLRFQSDLSMEAIAERTGFSTAKYFIESFKKQKGVSPLQYRKNKETGEDRNSEF
ncbi:MAG: response regulator [Clostridia bacterium]|nr:response regulator [Clostridia bacterium]